MIKALTFTMFATLRVISRKSEAISSRIPCLHANVTKSDSNFSIGKSFLLIDTQGNWDRVVLMAFFLLYVRRTDPDRDYTYYDLTKDADHILSGTNRRAKHSFSRVKHYPPNRLSSIKARKRHLEKRIERSKSIFNSVAPIDVGNLSRSMHKEDSGIPGRKSTDVRSRTSSEEISVISTLGALAEDKEEET
jgi:hypothetical protein